MVLLLAAEARRRRNTVWTAGAVLAGVVFCSFLVWAVPHTPHLRLELHQNAGQMALSALYPALGTAFLAVAAVQVLRALRGPADGSRSGVPDHKSRPGRAGYAYTDR